MTQRTCNTCNVLKDNSEFYDATRNCCKDCTKTRTKKWQQENRVELNAKLRVKNTRPESIAYRKNYYLRNKERIREKKLLLTPEERRTINRSQKLKSKYNMTEEDYTSMFLEQNGECKICKSSTSQRAGDAYLYIDHDHVSGKVRGLLCHHCNAGIGHFKDDPTLLLTAIEYLNAQ